MLRGMLKGLLRRGKQSPNPLYKYTTIYPKKYPLLKKKVRNRHFKSNSPLPRKRGAISLPYQQAVI